MITRRRLLTLTGAVALPLLSGCSGTSRAASETTPTPEPLPLSGRIDTIVDDDGNGRVSAFEIRLRTNLDSSINLEDLYYDVQVNGENLKDVSYTSSSQVVRITADELQGFESGPLDVDIFLIENDIIFDDDVASWSTTVQYTAPPAPTPSPTPTATATPEPLSVTEDAEARIRDGLGTMGSWEDGIREVGFTKLQGEDTYLVEVRYDMLTAFLSDVDDAEARGAWGAYHVLSRLVESGLSDESKVAVYAYVPVTRGEDEVSTKVVMRIRTVREIHWDRCAWHCVRDHAEQYLFNRNLYRNL